MAEFPTDGGPLIAPAKPVTTRTKTAIRREIIALAAEKGYDIHPAQIRAIANLLGGCSTDDLSRVFEAAATQVAQIEQRARRTSWVSVLQGGLPTLGRKR